MDLLLETATDVCSVAVAEGDRLRAVVTATGVYQHASHLTVFIRRALEEAGVVAADLRRVVLSDGPGSYTSLRVGAATAKGLCVALPDLDLVVVPTLTSLAFAAEAPLLLATINSRRGEVFGQLFAGSNRGEGTAVRPVGAEGPTNVRLTEPDWLARLTNELNPTHAGAPLLVVGPGQERVAEHAGPDERLVYGGPDRCGAELLLPPLLAGRGSSVEVAAYEPFYLNPPFVTKSRKKPLG